MEKTNIYFIKRDDEIKIGHSTDILRRLDELQIANAVSLRILYVIKDVEEAFEKHVHSVCNTFHIRGEWFEIGVLDHLLKHPYYKEAMIPYSINNA
ncbi:MAG: hypothetical protein DRJ01_06640 [Bacteroidetes bacterium]|nr:MAG: hypothetical protein DRJ01_06640 [Bacteroidota bacterium]